MNQLASHQATYSTSEGETGTLYFVNAYRLAEGLKVWFGIESDEAEGEWRYFESRHVTWGPVAEGVQVFVCRCNILECSQPVKREGGFRPGHDAKLVSHLVGQVKAEQITVARAHALLADRPKLQEKLLKRVG